MRRFTDEEKEYILNNLNKTSVELGEILGRSPSSIRSFKSKFKKDDNLFKPHKMEFIMLYYSTTITNLSDYYGRDRHTISKYAKSIGLVSLKSFGKKHRKIKNEMENKRKSKKKEYYDNINYDFFETIDSPTKAYYLGLLASDGSVCLHRTKEGIKKDVRITLSKEDSYILKHFYDVLNINRKPIIENNMYASIQIRSDKMFNDLDKYGIVPNKTWKLNIKNIPKEFYSSFLLGYFDGDGSISKHFKTPSSTDISYCGTESAMKSISHMLDYLNIDYSLTQDKRVCKYNSTFCIIRFVNSTQKYIFLKTIYSNEINCLIRKKNLVNKFMKLIEDNKTNRSENKEAIKQYECRLKGRPFK